MKLDIMWEKEIKESKSIIIKYKERSTKVELKLYLNINLTEINIFLIKIRKLIIPIIPNLCNK